MSVSLVWFRNDLRLQDHPALSAAIAAGHPYLLVYILETDLPEHYQLGGASRWWLHHSLSQLAERISLLGGQLLLRRGRAGEILPELVQRHQVTHFYSHTRFEPDLGRRDQQLARELQPLGVQWHHYNGHLLYHPARIATQAGTPYKVFSQFWHKGCAQHSIYMPELAPIQQLTRLVDHSSESLDQWQLTPRINWDRGFTPRWQPGEAGAWRRLRAFSQRGFMGYHSGRDHPAGPHQSMLSPHLHWGEIAPWQVYQQLSAQAASEAPRLDQDHEHFIRELGWREFSYYLLYHWPELPLRNWRRQFDHFPWQSNPQHLQAWQRGQTGFPLLDAGMRQLWQQGWIPNRVRMLCGSFLVKQLQTPWQLGERWFWDTLVDADMASNSASWQWCSGSGADAAPYFRIFNPVLQSKKFDPEGDYIRTWVPELSGLDAMQIHEPWQVPPLLLQQADVCLGQSYPYPIVDLAQARQQALAAYASCQEAAKQDSIVQ